MTPPAVLARVESASLLRPSAVDARLFAEIDRAAFASASAFEALDLSPVAPLGADRALGRIDTNSALSALRSSQLIADPTTAMALEAARRRRGARSRETLRFCASHRCVRLQPVDFPGFSPHFRLFAALSAGRDRGSHTFELEALRDHARIYLDLFRRLTPLGYDFGDPEVSIADTHLIRELARARGLDLDEVGREVHAHRPGAGERLLEDRGVSLPTNVADPTRELAELAGGPVDAALRRFARIQAEVFAPLATEFPEVRFRLDASRLVGLSYYDGPCLQVWARDVDGALQPVGDGGTTRWTAALLVDRKERSFASAIGSEFLAKRFRRHQ